MEDVQAPGADWLRRLCFLEPCLPRIHQRAQRSEVPHILVQILGLRGLQAARVLLESPIADNMLESRLPDLALPDVLVAIYPRVFVADRTRRARPFPPGPLLTTVLN